MKKYSARQLAIGGMIAALYVVLTYLANMVGLASGAVQVRMSEALTILPCLTVAAVPGLTVGCVLANLLTGCAIWDVVFGSLATLLGAIGTRLMRKTPNLAWIPPVVSNTVIVPIILQQVYGVPETLWFLVLTVGAGELISCGLLGLLIYKPAARIIPAD
ncbi:MAG: QueT transporter family protein [Clostridia bacterium]|nr:QueT transporter family protein [Clostridia bacterium]